MLVLDDTCCQSFLTTTLWLADNLIVANRCSVDHLKGRILIAFMLLLLSRLI